ncbi:MAG: twin-arginine translocation signal domain-containing protein, partial [Bacteroidetes bacterium]|nr:twin-arginine translocation signal domain-containing protein [Bacteroidota bacterium]
MKESSKPAGLRRRSFIRNVTATGLAAAIFPVSGATEPDSVTI